MYLKKVDEIKQFRDEWYRETWEPMVSFAICIVIFFIMAFVDFIYLGDERDSALRPIHEAVLSDNCYAVKQIIEKYPEELNVKTQKGDTAMHLAAKDCRKEIMALLIEKGGIVTIKNKKGISPVYLASLCNDEEVKRIVTASIK